MGSWVHKGKPMRYFLVKRSETGAVCDIECTTKANKDSNAYKLTQIYYHHKGTSEFRKTIFYVHGMLHLVIVLVCTYICACSKHLLIVAPA